MKIKIEGKEGRKVEEKKEKQEGKIEEEKKESQKGKKKKKEGRKGRDGVVVVCWLLNVPATCQCISGTDLLRQFYVLPLPTEIEVADQTFHLTQSQYTDTGPTSPSADPITPGAWQGSH